MNKRFRFTVTGRVQGVGFRPTVYRHACEAGLTGWVQNAPAGVLIEVEGPPASVEAFRRQLEQAPPPHARIDVLAAEEVPQVGSTRFLITASRRSGDLLVGIPPDLATCAECVQELFDPSNRRYRYPFLNCTNCGPRFTIAGELPYDRAQTSMAAFTQCAACLREYHDPLNRRFDAQPNACAACGPRLALWDASAHPVPVADALAETARLLAAGAIVAIKSLGGFHLCCDARNVNALRELRRRKHRPAQSLAVMFRTIHEIRDECEVQPEEEAELCSAAAPIVVLRRSATSRLPALLSPDTADIGALLPYTPLHHLLLALIGPLVMTSGNRTEEPIAIDAQGLRELLGPVADYALVHDRDILRRCDDSVVKVVRRRRLLLRRSRGWVPGSIRLPLSGPPVLACGAEWKNLFGLTRESTLFLSQHIGDLNEYSNNRFYHEAIIDMLSLLKIQPRIVAHDLHPDYASTRFALAFPAEAHVGVQHHHAHIAAGMAEHQLTAPVIGVALDGTGWGPDGTAWGGEFLWADLKDFRRLAHFQTYRLPGADEAIRHPARMAFSCLKTEFGADADRLVTTLLPGLSDAERRTLHALIQRGTHAPLTSSAGRLFDAVSALLGFQETISYEGQAAIRLQTLAQSAPGREAMPYPFHLDSSVAPQVLSFGPTFHALVDDLQQGVAHGRIALRFHHTVAQAVCGLCKALAARESIRTVVLSGGVFQNELLLSLVLDELQACDLVGYCHHAVPPNDACLALGQAAVALARSRD